MHAESYEKVEKFVEVYLTEFRSIALEVLDFGSQQVSEGHLTYRTLFNEPCWRYRGLDIASGLNVDIVVADPYDWNEVADDSIDLVVSGQALEHVSYFWLSAFEIGRVLRPGGIAVLIAPSAGAEHRYPVDCWRFYRDGFAALAAYLRFELLDVFTDWGRAHWQDSVLVMRKPVWDADERSRYQVRAWHQRAALDPTTLPPVPATEPPASSPLASVLPGALTPVLEDIRVRDPRFRLGRVANRVALPIGVVANWLPQLWRPRRSPPSQSRVRQE